MAVALLVAAGRGERLGSDGPKAFVRCGGRPLLEWSIDALRASPGIDRIVVALPAGVSAPPGTEGVQGGEHRPHSVRAALRHAGDAEVVVVHDAARPLVTADLVQDCLDVLRTEDCDGAIAAAPVTDTIKESAGEVVLRTLDRTRLWAVQTPQVFPRAVLERAHDADPWAAARATDDAALVEVLGCRVVVVDGDPDNRKITHTDDLEWARQYVARQRSESAAR